MKAAEALQRLNGETLRWDEQHDVYAALKDLLDEISSVVSVVHLRQIGAWPFPLPDVNVDHVGKAIHDAMVARSGTDRSSRFPLTAEEVLLIHKRLQREGL